MARRKALAERIRAELPREIDDWARAFAEMDEVAAFDLLSDLHAAWVDGEVGAEVFSQAIPIRHGEVDRRVGRLLAQLPEELTTELRVERDVTTESDARRWCWAPGWSVGQDEDLLLMRDELVPALLDEASQHCTKRDYALEIVEHRARDATHHALWDGAAGLRERLDLDAAWVQLARAADASGLAAYLERLAGYRQIQRVDDRAQVAQRVLDLRRCRPDEKTPVEAHRHDDRWIARLDRANLLRGDLIIEVGSGRMWAEQRE